MNRVVSAKIFRQEDYSKRCDELIPGINDEIRFFIEEGVIPSKDETIVSFRYFNEDTQLDSSAEVLTTPASTLKEM